MSDPVDKLSVEIGGNTQGLQDALEGAVGHLTKFGELGQVAVDLIEGPAGFIAAAYGLAKVLGDLDKEFGEEQKAQILFNTALQGSVNAGFDFTEKANAAVESIMKMTGASDESAKQMITTLAATGRTADEIDKMTTAAEGLSNATGVSLDTAFTQINATFSGTSGRLGRLNPELKDLTKAQLESGAAVDILVEKYGKFSDALEYSTSVSVDVFKNKWNEVKAAMGSVLSADFNQFRLTMDAVFDQILSPSSGLNSFAKKFNAIFDIINNWSAALVGFGPAKKIVKDAMDELSGALDKANLNMGDFVSLSAEYPTVAAKVVESAKDVAAFAKQQAVAQAKYDADETAAAKLRVQWALDQSIATAQGFQDQGDAYYEMNGKFLQGQANIAKAAKEYRDAWQSAQDLAIAEGLRLQNMETRQALMHYQQIDYARTIDGQRIKQYEDLAIKSGQNIADGLQNNVENALVLIGQNLVDGGQQWQNLGQLAISSIAAILKGIGNELVSLSAVAFGQHDYATAVADAAGATAAFVASGAMNGIAEGMKGVASATSSASDQITKVMSAIGKLQDFANKDKAGVDPVAQFFANILGIDTHAGVSTVLHGYIDDAIAAINKIEKTPLQVLKEQESTAIAAFESGGATSGQLSVLTKYFDDQIKVINDADAEAQEKARVAAETTMDKIADAYNLAGDAIKGQLAQIQDATLSFADSLSSIGKDIGSTLIDNIKSGANEADFMGFMGTYMKNAILQAAIMGGMGSQLSAIGAEIATDIANGTLSANAGKIHDELSSLYNSASSGASQAMGIIDSVFPQVSSVSSSSIGPSSSGYDRTGSTVTTSITFNSPLAIDASQASSLLKNTMRDLAYQGVTA